MVFSLQFFWFVGESKLTLKIKMTRSSPKP
jgi:hypothetical protein